MPRTSTLLTRSSLLSCAYLRNLVLSGDVIGARRQFVNRYPINSVQSELIISAQLVSLASCAFLLFPLYALCTLQWPHEGEVLKIAKTLTGDVIDLQLETYFASVIRVHESSSTACTTTSRLRPVESCVKKSVSCGSVTLSWLKSWKLHIGARRSSLVCDSLLPAAGNSGPTTPRTGIDGWWGIV